MKAYILYVYRRYGGGNSFLRKLVRKEEIGLRPEVNIRTGITLRWGCSRSYAR